MAGIGNFGDSIHSSPFRIKIVRWALRSLRQVHGSKSWAPAAIPYFFSLGCDSMSCQSPSGAFANWSSCFFQNCVGKYWASRFPLGIGEIGAAIKGLFDLAQKDILVASHPQSHRLHCIHIDYCQGLVALLWSILIQNKCSFHQILRYCESSKLSCSITWHQCRQSSRSNDHWLIFLLQLFSALFRPQGLPINRILGGWRGKGIGGLQTIRISLIVF